MEIRPSTVAWVAAPVAVFAYDKWAPAKEMMSERADEWMEHPIKSKLFATAVIALGLHLTNSIDPKYDIFSHMIKAKESD